ncbi:MAG: ribonuclease Z [Cyclobacteriaceae bacterium]|nr:ribonuclease Z [Cyclobacteriaceae bacterium]
MSPEFEITILGNTSSIPMHGRNHTAQVLRFGQEFFLLDCGEGTQHQLQRFKIKSSKISAIFISHLHGDHYLGLLGLLSSFHLSKRTQPLSLFGPKGLDEILTTHFRWSHTQLCYPLTFVPTQDQEKQVLLDQPRYSLSSFPLSHRIPTTGFLFQEKEGPRALIKEKVLENKLPIAAIQRLRSGEDYLDASGEWFRSEDFTYPLPKLRSYAFCSDTAFDERLVPYLQGVDLLYHEATFMEAEAKRAADTYHSTAKQAATLALLCGASTLLLGHFSSRYVDLSNLLSEAQSVFSNSLLSEEGKTYALPLHHE